MGEPFDTTTRPAGELALTELINAVAHLDDALVERHFLEVKSEIDLTTKEGLAKVAKFILAAANRMPDKAATAFDGHALMILGVGNGGVVGVKRVEAKDLSDGVLPYLSAAGPAWDFQRIMVGGVDVLVIDVEPPQWGHTIFACHREGPGLANGGVYVRADGASRPATGSEIDQLGARASRGRPSDLTGNEVEISLVGSVRVPKCKPEILEAYLRRRGEVLGVSKAWDLLNGTPESPGELGSRAVGRMLSQYQFGYRERRSPDEFLQEVTAWEEKVRDVWLDVVAEVAGGTFAPVEVSAQNHGQLFVADVELILEISGPVRAVDWYDEPYVRGDLPEEPRPWGQDPNPLMALPSFLPQPAAAPRPRTVRFENHDRGVRITANLPALRPETPYVTCERDFVLVAESVDCAPSATWSLTARDMHAILRGELTVAVDPAPEDVSEEIWKALTQ